jgi:hypothetical protein
VKSWVLGMLAGLVGGVVGGLAFAMIAGVLPIQSSTQRLDKLAAAASQTPAREHLDALRCPRGLQQIVEIRGTEDGFSKNGDELSRVDPAMVRFGMFADYEARAPRAVGRRDYDEGGVDRALVDYFKVPKDVVSAVLVVRMRPIGQSAQNDGFQIIPQVTYKGKTGAERLAVFGLTIGDPAIIPVGNPTDGVFEIALEGLTQGSTAPSGTFASYINQAVPSNDNDADTHVSLIISDDTMVDVAAISWCTEPSQVRGVTFVEHSDKPLGTDISLLSCSGDPTQNTCDPFSGDTLCTAQLPLACFQSGNLARPERLATLGWGNSFNGGQVKVTGPISASSFKTRLDADAFCAAQFGQGWRVLQYADGTAAAVVSQSPIEPRTRVWVEISDQPRGRCWDRPPLGSIPAVAKQ